MLWWLPYLKAGIFQRTIQKKSHAISFLSVCLHIPPLNFWIPESFLMKFGMYIMAPDPISTVYLKNPLHQSVSVSACCQATAWQKSHHGNEYEHNNTRIVGDVIFYVIRVVSNEIRRLVLPRTFCFILWIHTLYCCDLRSPSLNIILRYSIRFTALNHVSLRSILILSYASSSLGFRLQFYVYFWCTPFPGSQFSELSILLPARVNVARTW
jgi:hypothetical protein